MIEGIEDVMGGHATKGKGVNLANGHPIFYSRFRKNGGGASRSSDII